MRAQSFSAVAGDADSDDSLWLSTPRLLLRPILEDDARWTSAGLTEDVVRTLVTWDSARDPAGALARIKEQIQLRRRGLAIDWAIIRKRDNLSGGWISLWTIEPQVAALGFWLTTGFQKQGIIREAAPPAIACGCEFLDVQRITTWAYECNEPSVRALHALGFAQTSLEDLSPDGRRKLHFELQASGPSPTR